MGQNQCVQAKANIDEEKESEIWSTVLHISDRDVLVQNVGRNKREKVKLNRARNPCKLENIHLANTKRLEGIPSFKRRNASCAPTAGHTAGILNEGYVENMQNKFSSESKHSDNKRFVKENDIKGSVEIKE